MGVAVLFKTALAKSDLEPMTQHDLRHAAAGLAIRAFYCSKKSPESQGFLRLSPSGAGGI